MSGEGLYIGLFWDGSGWQALCKRCHDKMTAREDSRPVYKYI